MRTASQQAARGHVVAQANLVALALFGGATSDQLAEFVRCGHLGPAAPDADDYDGEAMKTAVENARGQLGILKDKGPNHGR